MRIFVVLCVVILLSINAFNIVFGVPVSRTESVAKSMMDIPQWHCLRYFKHDIHLMRRCRNYRVPMLRRPSD